MGKIAYHFTGDALRDGRPVPAIGEWLEHDGHMIICKSGLHASEHPFDALRYAPGHMLHLVECDDIGKEQGDKFVCRRRKIIKSINAESMLREFARKQALSVVHLWDAPDVMVKYLNTGDESLRHDAKIYDLYAWDSQAGNLAREAAMSATMDAEWAAARNAAREAALSATRAVWFHARLDAARLMFKEMVEEAFREGNNE